MAEIMKGKPLPQGCSKINNSYNFSIAVPKESACELLLYKRAEKEPFLILPLEEEDSAGILRCLSVALKEVENIEYNYQIDGKIVLDPYARSIVQYDDEMRANAELDGFDWEEDLLPRLTNSETIAYALHVRGFTKHPSSKVRSRGTFLGIFEKIDYLKSLGVNQLHLMPVYEFEDEQQGRTNYWGYGNGYFFAPKRKYAVSDPVFELKTLIKKLHQEKIEVILEMPFVDGTPQSQMLDALRYWMQEYHIDGFILNPYVVNWQMVCSDPMLSHTKLFKKNDEFQNAMRHFLKGDAGMTSAVMWWSKYIPTENGDYNYITNNNGFTLADLVSYNEKHNEENGELNLDGIEYNISWNCGEEGETKDPNIIELRKNQMKNALYFLFLSQGIPCLLAGDEFGNTQQGNNNAYCQDNEVSWLDWSDLTENNELHNFVKALISFRKLFKILRPEKQLDGSVNTKYGIPEISYHGEEAWLVDLDDENRQFSIFYHKAEKVDEFCLVVYNMHWENHKFGLPILPDNKKWHEAASTKDGIHAQLAQAEMKNIVEVEPRTIKVFVGK